MEEQPKHTIRFASTPARSSKNGRVYGDWLADDGEAVLPGLRRFEEAALIRERIDQRWPAKTACESWR